MGENDGSSVVGGRVVGASVGDGVGLGVGTSVGDGVGTSVGPRVVGTSIFEFFSNVQRNVSKRAFLPTLCGTAVLIIHAMH